MDDRLLITQTKLVIPQRRKELLSRARLLDLLSDLLDYRLIIIAAPAGYGKTSLLIDFTSQFEWPFCWYALDPLDNDLHCFLSHFVMSIQAQFPEFGKETISVLSRSPADQINTEYLITTLTNDIYDHISEHFVVVLDDYHLIRGNAPIDQFISNFIQRADDNCHIAITSRQLLTLPDLPLMVARSQVGGLSIEELAFTPDEIHRLFHQVFKHDIDFQEAQDLAAQTDGWITGLLLTSQTLKKGLGEPVKITRASGIGLYEYLTQQVFDQQPAEMQSFLLRSSILEEFNSQMCEVVLGPALAEKLNYERLMDRLVHDNLFVLPVDDEYRWLRYHHLFRDFLQTKLDSTHPEDAEQIRLRLAQYFYKQRDYERVVDIYQRLNQTERIVALVEEIGASYIAKGRMGRLSEWLALIPEDVVIVRPRLLALQAAVAVNQGRIQEGKNQLDMVVRQLRKTNDQEQLAENLIRRSSALRLLGRYDQAAVDAHEAIQLTEGRINLLLLFAEALRVRGAAAFLTGQMRAALEDFNQALAIFKGEQVQEHAARILVEIGALYQNLGQFEEAEEALQESLAYLQEIGDSTWLSTILNNLGVLQHFTGNFIASFYNLEKSISYAQMTGDLHMQSYALASIGDLYRDLEAYDEALDAYDKSISIARKIENQFLLFFLHIAEGRLALLRGDLTRSKYLLDAACSKAKQSRSGYEENKCLLEMGALAIAEARFTDAKAKLEQAAGYFSQQGHMEDSVRLMVLIMIANARSGQEIEALDNLLTLITALQDPAKKVACLSNIQELRAHIKPLKRIAPLSEQIIFLQEKAAALRREIQQNRRKVRSQASVVPFAPARITIRTFGKTEISVNTRALTISDWKTTTSRDLFLLFLAHPEGLTKEEVGEIMWPDSSPAELKLRFKNAIYRMRHAIGSEVVVFNDNYYQFNRYIDYEYDVQNFIAFINQASEKTNTEKKKEYLQSAVRLYQGDYLPEIDGTWVLADRHKYHNMHMRNLLELAELFNQTRNYEQGLQYCQLAIQLDACQEEAYRLSMQIHAQLGNKAAVSRQFYQCQSKLLEEVGVEPSPQTVSLYRSLVS